MAQVWIDGQAFDADPTHNLLEVALAHQLPLPYFCWHPALGSVGACRQCAVKQYKNEDDERGKVVMACMTPAEDGTRISIEDAEACRMRKHVVEWLMTNHPHDCPVCDEGGECHLQDMTVMAGHTYRRFRFDKRTYANQDLGPLVHHEMNRCIQCYRCVRFYRDYAGGTDFHEFASHDHVYFGRHADGVLESEFSGNLVEICPTGVFTDKPLKQHYVRKWDLQTAPSVCPHCSLGCNITPGEHRGTLRRVRARYNSEVNRYFLCDRGRYGYEFVNHERRLVRALHPRGANRCAEPLTNDEAQRRLTQCLRSGANVIGIGSPRASLESNAALQLAVGAERFYQGTCQEEHRLLCTVEDILRRGPSRPPSLADVEKCDVILVLGEDLTNTAPLLALAVRQAARIPYRRRADAQSIPEWHDAAIRELQQGKPGQIHIATGRVTKLEDVAETTYHGSAAELAKLGFAIAQQLDDRAPKVDAPQHLIALAARIAEALSHASRPLVICGMSLGSEALLRAGANVAWACSRQSDDGRRAGAELVCVVPECNSLGAHLLGGNSLDAALKQIEDGAADAVVVVENDLYQRLDSGRLASALARLEHLVVIDHLAHRTASEATLVLPAATFAESRGTFVNCEGRAQRFERVFLPDEPVKASHEWLYPLLEGVSSQDELTATMAKRTPTLRPLLERSPPAPKVPTRPFARQTHRRSGRTAERVHLSIHEQAPVRDVDSPYTSSMEGAFGLEAGAHTSEFWAPGYNSIQALTRFQQEVGGPLQGELPGVRLFDATRGDFEFLSPGDEEPARGPFSVVREHHIFGSEELSALSPTLDALAPAASIGLHPDDIDALGLRESPEALVEADGQSARMRVAAPHAGLRRGEVTIPAGAMSPFKPVPEWVSVRKP